MKKILFPFDFSETSLNAFKYALHLADKINADITTLHVYEKLSGIYLNYYDVMLSTEGRKKWSEFEEYKGEVPKLREVAEQENLTHINVRHSLQEGDAVEVITKRASIDKIDFIVMGTTGASGIVGTFLGSVTEKVINRVHCAVLAIPEHAHYRPVSKMLFLSKFKDTDIPRIKETHRLANLMDAKVKVLQVKKHHDENESGAIAAFKSALPGTDIHYQILASNDIEETINDYIEIESIGIVVLPSHNKNLFKSLFVNSLARKLVFHSTIPVLKLNDKVRH